MITIAQFIAKWRRVALTERSAAQQHFLDLCELVGHPKPAEVDPTGDSFTFERGAAKEGGGDGWADVWKRSFFAIEYKGRHKNLAEAYRQLLLYRESLENPLLLVTCDMDLIVIHTNFNNTATRDIPIKLEEMARAENIEALNAMFFAPEKLKPGVTSEAITTKAASQLADIAQALRSRGVDPHQAALFLDRLVFCLFAEDIDLLPKGLFSDILEKSRRDPARFSRLIGQLFEAMAHGGDFGAAVIRHFNGNLFSDTSTVDLTTDELELIYATSSLDWSAVDPSIFGTLFVRGMDPAKRSQLGAEYTSRADIETIVEPVVMQPLRQEWAALKETVKSLLTTGEKKPATDTPSAASRPSHRMNSMHSKKKAQIEAETMAHRFLVKLSQVKVLDAACGSGNFLYVTLQKLKDLEKEAILFFMDSNLGGFLPQVGPWQLYGIEIDPYAYDLAQMTVWIGYLQWTKANGFGITQEPVLRPMKDNFRLMDAIMADWDKPKPHEPEWPQVDCIVGNPPFLGNKKMRSQLGAEYCTKLWNLYADRLPGQSDLCCYWFEKARAMVEAGRCRRVGLLATTGIRQVGARRVLERIHDSCHMFFAESDRNWVLDGASVRISMVGFGNKSDTGTAVLDGKGVAAIHADLTSGLDFTHKQPIAANLGRCFMGTTKVGAFDVDHQTAIDLLSGVNPHGKPSSDVVRPFKNGSDLVRADSGRWIVDFGVNTPKDAACLYEAPFKHVVQNVKPEREENNDAWRRTNWWLLGRSISTFRSAVGASVRYIATPRVAKHRVFVWLDTVVLPDSKVIAITLDDDANLGVLQSRVHAAWTLATCGWHGKGNDVTYNPTTCFETFPFPFVPGKEPASDPRVKAIGDAAKELDHLRTNWLNPPEWTREEVLEYPGSTDGPWKRYIVPGSEKKGIGTVRYPRTVPKDAECAKKLAKRTLTNLYNERPTWLEMAHKKLDEAVCAAYGWPADMTDEQILEKLLEMNRGGV